MTRPIGPTMEHDRKRWVMTIALDEEAPDAEAQALMDAVAAVAMKHEPRSGWDATISASYE